MASAVLLLQTDNNNIMCREAYEIKVGDGEDGYMRSTSSFEENKIGSLAWAVIINPLHPDMPKISIFMNPTCNRFNAAFVKHQWQGIKCLYDLHLGDTLGPLIGQASDGDARKWNPMMQMATSKGDMYHVVMKLVILLGSSYF